MQPKKSVSFEALKTNLPAHLAGSHQQDDPELHCETCHDSCMECKGPGPNNCTVCPASLMLYIEDGRCIKCCKSDEEAQPTDCCICTETLEDCVLRKGFPPVMRDGQGKPVVFAITSVLLIICVGVIVALCVRSRTKPKIVDRAKYEKLPNSVGASASSETSRQNFSFRENLVLEYKDRENEDEEEDDDIVYMGQDGTVYRRFKYGLLDEEDEDELEYDDESYSFK
ncbi:proprotein convertase subtilisin/kexin type 5-like [Protopterus annectens]|uniref:proprotein convertase subtilisin/kexin type 5-like n=1 Tax=Protopterus annectens TaxID=7888 RepID=UPI001CFA6B5A|nr:proprotein convertase subtilisin/kexin type 5-like [Protopterus annectens]